MADTKVSALTAASDPTGPEAFHVVQSAADRALTVAQVLLVPVVTDATTARTLALTDHGKAVRFTGASAVTVTVPTNASVALKVGSVVTLRQAAAGQITVAAASGVTVNKPTSLTFKSREQGSTIMLHKVGTDEWDLTGDLAAP